MKKKQITTPESDIRDIVKQLLFENNEVLELQNIKNREVILTKVSQMIDDHKKDMLNKTVDLVGINKRIGARMTDLFNEFSDKLTDILAAITQQKQETAQKIITDFGYLPAKVDTLELRVKDGKEWGEEEKEWLK